MTRSRAAVVALVVLALAGCGARSVNPESKTGPSPTAPASSPPRTTSASPTAKPLAPGYRFVTAKKSGLRFAIPKSWSLLNAAGLEDPALISRMKAYADRLNLTSDQLKQVFSRIDLMAISPTLTPQSYAEVEVLPMKLLAELPSRESLRAQFAAMNVKALSFRAVRTPVGDGLIAEVSKVVPGNVTVYSEGLFVRMKSGIVALTVTAKTLARARQVVDQLTATFRATGSAAPGSRGATVGS